MDLVVSLNSDTPIYAQIVDQIRAQILKGDLASGAALPPIRSVARMLEVSVITVKRAWEELDREGLIYGVVGKGSFVAARPVDSLADQRREVARQRLSHELGFYRELGLTWVEFTDLARQQWQSDQSDPSAPLS
ncbi:MAG: GntR family transcriptional regulator [Propionibacteriaceae bacterium]|jgi:GntR family transcriptional regulator|nr:GntR family transcriptional regulator [Propionibacteriaceae bacterium]